MVFELSAVISAVFLTYLIIGFLSKSERRRALSPEVVFSVVAEIIIGVFFYADVKLARPELAAQAHLGNLSGGELICFGGFILLAIVVGFGVGSRVAGKNCKSEREFFT